MQCEGGLSLIGPKEQTQAEARQTMALLAVTGSVRLSRGKGRACSGPCETTKDGQA